MGTGKKEDDGLGKVVGPGGHLGLSQLDLSFGPVENGIEAGDTVSVSGAGVVRVVSVHLQGHGCLNRLKFVFAC